MSKTVTYAQLIAMVWLVWEHGRGERTRNELMQAYVIGGFVSVGLAFSALVGSAGFRQTGGINANDFAMVVVVGIPMAWHLVLRARRTVGARYWLNLAYIPTALVAIVLSASRGGLIMAIVALSVIALTFTRLGALRQTILLLVTVVGTWAVFTYLPSAFPDLQQNFERLAGTAGELREGTLSNRSLIWSSGLQAFAERPAFGYGLGAFREAVTPYYGRGASPHSSFLSVLVELGLLGLVVYVSLLVVAAAPGLLRASAARTTFLVLFATLLVGMIPLDLDDDKSVWFVLALLASQWPVVLSFVRERRPASSARAPAVRIGRSL